MAHKNNHLVIMAGGVGSRFCGMSTEEKPKQFIDVLGTGRTLLQLTFDRFEGICDPENVWVVTNKKYAALVQSNCPRFLRATSCRNHVAAIRLHVLPTLVGESRRKPPMPILSFHLPIILLPTVMSSDVLLFLHSSLLARPTVL